jgi:hypothetical protein
MWGYPKNRVYRTKPQTEIEAVDKGISGDVLHDTVDNFVARLQRVNEVEGSHIEHAVT